MTTATAIPSDVDRTLKTQYAFYLLRILKAPGAPTEKDPEGWPNINSMRVSTVIRRVIEPNSNAIVLRPSKLALDLLPTDPKKPADKRSFDLVPIEDASNLGDAQDWLNTTGQSYLDKAVVESHAIVRLACEWQHSV